MLIFFCFTLISDSLSQTDHKAAAVGKTFEAVPRKMVYTGKTSFINQWYKINKWYNNDTIEKSNHCNF